MGSLSLDQQKAIALASARARASQSAEGGIGSFVRNAANAATFNLADTIAAAGDATIPLDSGASSAPTWMQRLQENRGIQRGVTSADQAEHPVASFAGGFAGGFMNPATRALPVVNSFGGAVLQGAGVGAAYGAGGGISNQEDLGGITRDALTGGAAGGALGGTLYGAGKLIKGATQSADAALLNQNNIPTTIGQDLGGGFKRAEDAFTSMPYGGDNIIARQKEGISGFNRAFENNAIDPVGVKVPSNIASGNDAGNYLKTVGDAAYSHAYSGATLQHDPALISDLQSATNGMSHRLAGAAKSIDQDITDNVISRFDPNTGTLSSKDFNDAKDWLAAQSRTTQNMDNDQRAIAGAYGKALTVLKSGLSNQDPQRGAMLKAADTIYARRMNLINAAGNTNASAKGGLVMPAQFSRALDSSDGSAHGLNYSLGNLPMQDVVQAAQRTLPSSIPDSGTAIRRLLTGGLPTLAAAGGGAAVGGAAGILPAAALAALPMVATRALYSQTGQKAAKAALFGSPVVRAQIAQIVQRGAPGAFGLLGRP